MGGGGPGATVIGKEGIVVTATLRPFILDFSAVAPSSGSAKRMPRDVWAPMIEACYM